MYKRQVGGSSWIRRGGREFVTRRGDLIIADPTVPFEIQALRSYDHEMWSFPRALIDPHLAATQRPRSLHLSSRSGVNTLVLSYLNALGGQLDSLEDDEADTVADNFCRLLAVACGNALGEQRAAIAAVRLEEVKRYIGLHLADPTLTPEKAAAALKLSVRQLHRLFEPAGTSFAQYLLRRRLEECRSALTSPNGAGRSVTDIALGWGFNSLSTFLPVLPPRVWRGADGISRSRRPQRCTDRKSQSQRSDLGWLSEIASRASSRPEPPSFELLR